MQQRTQWTRRGFLRRAGLAGAAVSVGPTLLPSSVFGATAPSRRSALAAIGVGGMGSGNLNAFLNQPDVQVVAVCDVDRRHAESAQKRVHDRYKNRDCAIYGDFRELLARGDLDAVSLALPDHWHALVSTAAARAGCDIYGEKPLARSIREGRAICQAVQRYGRVWQTGSWQRSQGHFRRGAELVRNGRIGKVLRVEVGLPNGRDKSATLAVSEPPAALDYDFWLGPAPYRPFMAFGGGGAVHGQWRWLLDYSGGQLTDWAGHHIDIAHWGLGCDTTGPVKIVDAVGQYPAEGTFNAPYAYRFKAVYASGVEMIVANAAQQPKGMGTRWIGEKGWIYVNRGDVLQAEPASLLREQIGAGEQRLYVSTNHHRNFLDCVRSRALTITPVETAHRSISVGLLGEIAMLTGRSLTWDPATEQIANDPAASALLGRTYREPWVLET